MEADTHAFSSYSTSTKTKDDFSKVPFTNMTPAPRKPATRSPWALLKYYVRLWYYRYEVTLAVYIMEPWEKFLFNTLVLLLVALVFMAAASVPRVIQSVYSRAAHYLHEPSVAEAARTIISENVVVAKSALNGAKSASAILNTTTAARAEL